MYVTIEQLKAVDKNKLPFYIRKMLESAIQYVEEQGGKAWIHPHVLADFGIKGKEE
jgi:hypothetical protein